MATPAGVFSTGFTFEPHFGYTILAIVVALINHHIYMAMAVGKARKQ